MAGARDTRGARELLAGLVGRPRQTIGGAQNQVLEVRDEDVVVATARSPQGRPVPVAWIEVAPNRIQATGELEIGPPTVGYRSAFVGAVLRTLPNARIGYEPQRILLGQSPADWDLAAGAHLSRSERKARFGGALYGGIEPSAISPNVFLYSDPSRGEVYGYNYDGWADDGLFLYTGEGREGDQPMSHGNRAILQHREQGRAIRLFIADGQVAGTGQRQQQYVGEFEIDQNEPFSLEDAPDENGEDRTVFVFRLRPVGKTARREEDNSTYSDVGVVASSSRVPFEKNAEASFDVSARDGTTATRREGELVDRYKAWAGPAEPLAAGVCDPRGSFVRYSPTYTARHRTSSMRPREPRPERDPSGNRSAARLQTPYRSGSLASSSAAAAPSQRRPNRLRNGPGNSCRRRTAWGCLRDNRASVAGMRRIGNG